MILASILGPGREFLALVMSRPDTIGVRTAADCGETCTSPARTDTGTGTDAYWQGTRIAETDTRDFWRPPLPSALPDDVPFSLFPMQGRSQGEKVVPLHLHAGFRRRSHRKPRTRQGRVFDLRDRWLCCGGTRSHSLICVYLGSQCLHVWVLVQRI